MGGPMGGPEGLSFQEQKGGSVRNVPEHCSGGRLFGTFRNRAGTPQAPVGPNHKVT